MPGSLGPTSSGLGAEMGTGSEEGPLRRPIGRRTHMGEFLWHFAVRFADLDVTLGIAARELVIAATQSSLQLEELLR